MKMYIGIFMALIVFVLSQTVTAEPEMVLVKGDCFQMGDTFDVGDDDEKPVHEVCVDDFYIGKYEVTQGEWESIMETNPSKFKGNVNLPVERVSYDNVRKFIKKLRQRTGKKYRLPTEAEWEYAAQGGGKDGLWAGTSDEFELDEYAWYVDNSNRRTHPVGQKKPNGLGLYDMSGNVWEWVWDRYDEKYYERSPKNNPKGPLGGGYRVLRGGSWNSTPVTLRTATRGVYAPGSRSGGSGGFRLALSAK